MKLWMLTAIPICGILWSFAGAQGTSLAWRRYGVGIYIASISAIMAHNLGTDAPWCMIIVPLMLFATSQGYGRPDATDEGSPIGRFWFSLLKKKAENRFNQSHMTAKLTDVYTRATVAFLYGMALLPLISIGSFRSFRIGLGFAIVNTVYFSVFYPPNKMILKKYSLEEALIGAGVGLSASISVL